MGWFTARLGDFGTARDHCCAALTLHRHHRNLDGEAATLDSLGYIAYRTGAYRQAADHYHQALTMRLTLGNAYATADTLDRTAPPLRSRTT